MERIYKSNLVQWNGHSSGRKDAWILIGSFQWPLKHFTKTKDVWP
jgi:hypothetical protein